MLGYKSGAVYIDDRHLKNFSTKELARNIGVVMVLHDFSHAMEVSDWIVVVKDGKNTARASQRISSPRR